MAPRVPGVKLRGGTLRLWLVAIALAFGAAILLQPDTPRFVDKTDIFIELEVLEEQLGLPPLEDEEADVPAPTLPE